MALKLHDIISEDVKALIINLTGFEEDHGNFKACERFVLSNLLHSKYVSVNGHAVRRSVDGMVTKFFVHGLSDRGQELDSLVKEFLAGSSFKDHDTPDLQWCLLSLLLLLGENPTNPLRIKEENSQSSLSTETEEDLGFDWVAHLREGDEDFQQDWTEVCSNEDEADCIMRMENEFEPNHQSFMEVKQAPLQSLCSFPSQESVASSNVVEHAKSVKPHVLNVQHLVSAESWLKNNIQHDWWTKAHVDHKPLSSHPCSQSANLCSSDSVKNIKTSTLSEHKIVIEIIWLLSAPCDSAVFMKAISDDGLETHFRVRPHVTAPSLTEDVFSSFVSSVCVYADKIYELQSFCKSIHKNHEQKNVCGTMVAYGCALQYELKTIQEALFQLEQRAHKQSETLTFLILVKEMNPWLSLIDSLYKIHKVAVLDSKQHPNWVCAMHLLSVLLSSLRNPQGNVGINFRLFVRTFQVYIQIIDQWLSGGQLYDFHDEFFITKVETRSNVLGASFASRCSKIEMESLGVECPKALEALENCLLQAAQPLDVLFKLKRLAELRTHSPSRGSLERLFLSKLISDVEAYGQPTKPLNDEDSHKESDVWWKKLDHYLPFEDRPSENIGATKKLPLPNSGIDVKAVMSHLHRLEEPLFMKDFKALFQTPTLDSKSLRAEKELLDRLMVLSHSMTAHLPLESWIERAVLCLSVDRESIAGTLVADILFREHQLLFHINSAQSVFLLQAMHKLQPFLSYVFKHMLHPGGKMLINSHTLSVLLQDCMDPAQLSSYICMGDKDPEEMNGLDWIDSINIQYEVIWPLCAILGEKSQHIYNNILHLLLKVRWGLWILEDLDVTGFKYQNDSYLYKRLLYMRYWLLHVVRGSYNFLAGHILNGLWLKFDEDIKSAKDMHSIIRVHERFLECASHQTLNASKPEPIKSALYQLVILAENLHSLWNCGLSNVSVSKLNNMEMCYIHCHRFLAASLHSLAEEVGFQHLAVLSDLFNWSIPQEYMKVELNGL